MNQKKNLIMVILLFVGGSLLFSNLVQQESAKELFERALYLEETKGELEKAIEVYKRVVKEFPDERVPAAKAQLHIGICFEKLGLKEAQKAYQNVIDKYPEQTEEVKIAREKISVLLKAQALIEKGDKELKIRQVWAGYDVDTMGSPSPDGKYLSFVDWSTGDLSVRDLTTGQNRRLTNKGTWQTSDEFALQAKWSPDGKQIAYIWFNKNSFWDLRIWKWEKNSFRLLYSNPEKEIYEIYNWSADGKYILVTLIGKDRVHEVSLMDAKNGTYRPIIKSEKWPHPFHIRLSPDAQFIMFDSAQSPINYDIFIAPTNTGIKRPLIEHPAFDYPLDWTPDGKTILFASNRTGKLDIWAVSVENGRQARNPELVRASTGAIHPLGFTVDGSYFYSSSQSKRDIYIAEVNLQSGKLIKPPQKISRVYEGKNNASEISPDGRYLAYVSSRGSRTPIEASTICVYDFHSKEYKEFPVDLQIPTFKRMRWAEDSQSLYFLGRKEMESNSLHRLDLDSGNVTLIKKPDDRASISSCSRDGRFVFVIEIEAIDRKTRISRLFKQDLETGEKKEIYSSDIFLSFLTLSPDERHLAFVQYTGLVGQRHHRIFVLPTEGGKAKEILSDEEPISYYGLSWTRDSKNVLLAKRYEENGIMKYDLWIAPIDGSSPKKTDLSMQMIHFVSGHPDGKTLAFTAGESSKSEIWVMENFLPKQKDKK
jgi:Tol biopolymer transport system component